MLAALQAGNRGTQACITAASAVSGIIADLDTTIMFATAGTLNRENAETFADHRSVVIFRLQTLGKEFFVFSLICLYLACLIFVIAFLDCVVFLEVSLIQLTKRSSLDLGF